MDIFVTVVIQKHGKDKWGAFIPDFNMVIYGTDRIQVLGDAISVLRAIRYYRVASGLELEVKVTAEGAQQYCHTPEDMITVVAITITK